jgi:hypothetical protein
VSFRRVLAVKIPTCAYPTLLPGCWFTGGNENPEPQPADCPKLFPRSTKRSTRQPPHDASMEMPHSPSSVSQVRTQDDLGGWDLPMAGFGATFPNTRADGGSPPPPPPAAGKRGVFPSPVPRRRGPLFRGAPKTPGRTPPSSGRGKPLLGGVHHTPPPKTQPPQQRRGKKPRDSEEGDAARNATKRGP